MYISRMLVDFQYFMKCLLDEMLQCLLQVPDSGKEQPGLVHSSVPRFCDEIRYMREPYRKYFKRVFFNKTFRVYKVL